MDIDLHLLRIGAFDGGVNPMESSQSFCFSSSSNTSSEKDLKIMNFFIMKKSKFYLIRNLCLNI